MLWEVGCPQPKQELEQKPVQKMEPLQVRESRLVQVQDLVLVRVQEQVGERPQQPLALGMELEGRQPLLLQVPLPQFHS